MSGLMDIPQDKMEEAMQKSCDDQVRLLEKARQTCEGVESLGDRLTIKVKEEQ